MGSCFLHMPPYVTTVTQGEIRKGELIESCRVLGIPSSNVPVLDHRKLPDHPSTEWDVPLLAELILAHIKTYQINLVITFDDGGVSGHPNHRSVYAAVRSSPKVSVTALALRRLEVFVFHLATCLVPSGNLTWLSSSPSGMKRLRQELNHYLTLRLRPRLNGWCYLFMIIYRPCLGLWTLVLFWF